MRIEITFICLLLILLLLGIARKKSLFQHPLKTLLTVFVFSILLTGISYFYEETRFSGTYLQEYHGYPRSYYVIRISEALGEPIPATERTLFNFRYFIENGIVYAFLVYFILFIAKAITTKRHRL
jgi:hypothetical protein